MDYGAHRLHAPQGVAIESSFEVRAVRESAAPARDSLRQLRRSCGAPHPTSGPSGSRHQIQSEQRRLSPPPSSLAVVLRNREPWVSHAGLGLASLCAELSLADGTVGVKDGAVTSNALLSGSLTKRLLHVTHCDRSEEPCQVL